MVDILGLCSVCGKPGAMFTCHLCGRLVCNRCFDMKNNVCCNCKKGKH